MVSEVCERAIAVFGDVIGELLDQGDGGIGNSDMGNSLAEGGVLGGSHSDCGRNLDVIC